MPKKTYEQLVEENKWIKGLMTQASENMKEACRDRYELQQENEKLKEEVKEYKEYYDKWSPILTDIDGDEFCDLLSDYGWEYNDEDELVNICVDYENDEVDYYIDAGRKVVLKDGRIVKRQD
jgi:predicted nuclease with TOPRIM domain